MTTRGWAIVTGASGGIGAVFTRVLAQRGLAVLAVARAGASLAKIADEVRDAGGRVEALPADLASRVIRIVGVTNRLVALSGALTPRFILRSLMARMFAPTGAQGPSARPPSPRPNTVR
jgi:NAD(P)-dependent dehydrogenase (short-subunit alcohol dehydrogenase family)